MLVGVPTEEELEPYYDGYWTAQKSGICNIHKVPMKKTLVPISWGLPDTSVGPLPSTEIRFFPHARDYVNGGCEVDPARENAKVPIYICPECEHAQWRWIKAHPRDPWSKSWIKRHKTSNHAMEPTANRPYIQICLLMNATCNSRGGSSCSR